MKKLTFAIVWVTILLGLSSCQSADKKKAEVAMPQQSANDFVRGLVREDTVAVKDLVDKFMTYAQDKQYGQAAAMLYKLDHEDAWNEPLPLSNEEMESAVRMLKQIPVLSYRISNMKFESALKNEVKCAIVMRQADETTSEVVNNWYFKPVNYLGGWRLCLMD